MKKSPWSSWSFCKNALSNTALVKSFLWYIGSERLQHHDRNSLFLLENKSYSKWHEMKVQKGRESGDISRNRKGIIAFQDLFCLNSTYILQTQPQPSFTSLAGSQDVRFLADKIMQILQKDLTKAQSGLGRFFSGYRRCEFDSARDPLCKLGQDVSLSLLPPVPPFPCPPPAFPPPHPFRLGIVSH